MKNFRIFVQLGDEYDGWLGDTPSRSVAPEEMFEREYERVLARLVRMLAAQAELADAQQEWTWGDEDE